MKLGVALGYSGASFSIDADLIREIESLGYDSIWTSEAYGSDAISPAAWILALTSRITVGTAIIQMPSRTPTMAAMTANTLQALSGGRFVLGIGPSGPQVVEGWYGEPYGRPLTRVREYIEIVRQVLSRETPLTHDGFHYRIPFDGAGATGLGKPLKSILHARHPLKIFTGTFTPAGIRTAAEVADGFFPLFMNPERFDLFAPAIEEGFAKAAPGKSREDFEVLPFVPVSMGDDLDACRLPIKRTLALYVGGMGARGKNFYNDFARRLGYEDEAIRIQDLFLDGKHADAVAAVPDALVDDIALVGPRERIADRLAAWQEASARGEITTLLTDQASPEALRFLAETML
jgi:F420-dependent oxidoreductase-like protein